MNEIKKHEYIFWICTLDLKKTIIQYFVIIFNFSFRSNTSASTPITMKPSKQKKYKTKQNKESYYYQHQQEDQSIMSQDDVKRCSKLESQIELLKNVLHEKQIVFEKIANEVLRMLGLFERLSKMGETKRSEVVEAEQAVSFF